MVGSKAMYNQKKKESIDVKLHKGGQFEVATDQHRFKVITAGRRWGKSVLSRMMVLKWATQFPGDYWIVSPTFSMGKDIHWKQGFLNEIPARWIAKKNEAELELTLVNGSRISLRSAENPDRLRGVKLRGLVVDEIAQMRNWRDVWEEALRPTLTDYQAPAIFISTPVGYNHFYELWKKGQNNVDPMWKSWRFTSYDNPHIPNTEIEQARAELDEDSFAQEYLAEFKRFAGLVYKEFDRDRCVIEPIELKSSWTYYRGIDFGFVNPSAVVFVAIDEKGIMYIYDEIYQSGLQTPDLAQLIKQKSIGRMFTFTVGDSAQKSDIEEINKYLIPVRAVRKIQGSNNEGWQQYKIRKVSEKIKNGKMFVFSNCTHVIREFETYEYTEVKDGHLVKEIPMKLNDHALDALAYLTVEIPEVVAASHYTENDYGPKQNNFMKWRIR
jgi:PBSX family phage terminase large subunit